MQDGFVRCHRFPLGMDLLGGEEMIVRGEVVSVLTHVFSRGLNLEDIRASSDLVKVPFMVAS